MKEPRAIRFFYNKNNADSACGLLKKNGFDCYITEDKFEKLTLDKLGMRRRYRLYIEMNDINKIAEVLAKKLKKNK